MEKGIIEKVEDDDPCDFISPAFFVPKANGKVRLVTDYKYINQYLDRPVQPFMSSRQIADAIRPESRVFATMDMVQGYYQIALDEESSRLTTFLLPDGKYRYKRLPMGHVNRRRRMEHSHRPHNYRGDGSTEDDR